MLSLPFQAREAAVSGHFLRISQKSPPGTPFLGGKRPAIWYNGNQRITPMRGMRRARFDGRPLSEAREWLNYTQMELAERLCVSQAYISQVERGLCEYTPDLKRRVTALVATVTIQT